MIGRQEGRTACKNVWMTVLLVTMWLKLCSTSCSSSCHRRLHHRQLQYNPERRHSGTDLSRVVLEKWLLKELRRLIFICTLRRRFIGRKYVVKFAAEVIMSCQCVPHYWLSDRKGILRVKKNSSAVFVRHALSIPKVLLWETSRHNLE